LQSRERQAARREAANSKATKEENDRGIATPLFFRQTLEGHTGWVRSAVFSPDGKRLATVSDDFTARLWDAATGKAVQTLKGHIEWVNSVVFSPDGKWLATASSDRTARLWDVATGLEGHTNGVWSVVFSLDGKRLATASHDGTAMLWDAATGKAVQTLEGPTAFGRSSSHRTESGSRQRLMTARLGYGTTRRVNLIFAFHYFNLFSVRGKVTAGGFR
jgi:WD40 repeat protein